MSEFELEEALVKTIKEKFHYDEVDKCFRRKGHKFKFSTPVGRVGGYDSHIITVMNQTISMEALSWAWHTGNFPPRKPWCINLKPTDLSPENLTVDDEMIVVLRKAKGLIKHGQDANIKGIIQAAADKNVRLLDVMQGFPIDLRPAAFRKAGMVDPTKVVKRGPLDPKDGRLRGNLRPDDRRFKANKKAAPERDPDLLVDDDPDILV